jgi:hypothetical protein
VIHNIFFILNIFSYTPRLAFFLWRNIRKKSSGLAKDRSEHTKNVEPKTLLSCVPGFLRMCYKFFFVLCIDNDRGVEFLPSTERIKKAVQSGRKNWTDMKIFFPSLDSVDERGAAEGK